MDKSVSEIIDLAIQREEEAYDFYMGIHSKLEDPSVKDTIEFVAGEEKKHKAFLVGYREEKYGSEALRMTEVVEYKIAEYLEEPEISTETSRFFFNDTATTENPCPTNFIRNLPICTPKENLKRCC